MSTRIETIRLRLRRDDEGIALVMVISLSVVMAILVTTAISFAVNGITASRNTQTWDASLAAAYAGVEEYQSRLASDPMYWKYGNPTARFTTDSVSTVAAAPTANPAFGVGTSGTWATIKESSPTNPARFRYEVDNSDYLSTGVLRIRSTGVVGKSTRTIVADLKQKGFLDFLYFTDYEIRDPQMGGAACTPVYDWAVASRSCTELTFLKTDVLKGPVHSNDTLLICGARFTELVTTGNSKLPVYNTSGGSCPAAVFDKGVPTFSPVQGFPATNSELKKETRTDNPNGTTPGCLYTGPTSIEFLSNGKMTVKSPWSKLTNVTGDPATTGSVAPACGTLAALQSANGATVDVPKNNVIFVQNIPATGGANSSTSNQTGTTSSSTDSCKNQAGANVVGNGVGFPFVGGNAATNEVAPSPSTSYACRSGDVFVKGTLSGQVTVGAENYVYVTGDVVYDNAQKDLLGLVGQNAVWVYNPVNAQSQPLLSANRRIDAALLSVAHTFQVQNFDTSGVRGTLTVNGAIAQKFRGAVATLNGTTGAITAGYAKNYLYDTRFRYTAPPKFLSPVTTTYGVTVWIETDRAFDWNGSGTGA